MAITAADSSLLTQAQQSQLAQYTQQWEDAHNAGDTAGMDAAHSAAEALRNSAGYTSNDDGSFSSYIDNDSSSIPSYQSLINQMQAMVDENNAVAQANTQAQWEYNAEEAQKSRDWSEYMSNTSHQREVADLIAAGLNPILSANSGATSYSGATASGSSASNDTSGTSLFGNYLSSLISSATALNVANINAQSASNVADKYTWMNYKINQDFPSNAWQAFGPELQTILTGVESFIDKLNGSYNDSSAKGTYILDTSKDKSDVTWSDYYYANDLGSKNLSDKELRQEYYNYKQGNFAW